MVTDIEGEKRGGKKKKHCLRNRGTRTFRNKIPTGSNSQDTEICQLPSASFPVGAAYKDSNLEKLQRGPKHAKLLTEKTRM